MANTTTAIPTHLGFILDGNRRWAKEQGLPSLDGHRKGYEVLRVLAETAFRRGVKYVSAYVFSTENWSRSEEEISGLFGFVDKVAGKTIRELVKNNIRIVIIGDRESLSDKLRKLCDDAEQKSAHNTAGTLALCFNYGGTRELTHAVKQIVANGVSAEAIDEQVIADNLYHPEVPPLDLIIRSSGEQRISNFMLWRAAYAELYFTPVFWPALVEADLEQALTWYADRNRRFGGN